jgi:hypothetical protein
VTSLSCDTVPPRWSSSTATSAPSLRPARPEWFAAKLTVDPDVSQSSKDLLFHSLSLSHSHCHFLTRGDNNSWSGRCSPTSSSSYTNAASSSVSEGSAPPQGPFLDFSQRYRRSGCSFPKPQSVGFPEDLVTTVSHSFQSWLQSSVPSSDTLGGFPPLPRV